MTRFRLACSWFGFLLLLWCPGCLSANRALYPPQESEPKVAVYLSSNGFHSSLAIPVHQLSPEAAPTLRRLANRDRPPTDASSEELWVEVGWGDAVVYVEGMGNKAGVVAAALWPTPTVLHLWWLKGSATDHYAGFDVTLLEIELSPSGYNQLARRLEAVLREPELDPDAEGPAQTDPLPVATPGIYADRSAFYPARGLYLAGHNCNHWMARTLREAGLGVTPFWAATAGNLVWQTRRAVEPYQSAPVVVRTR